VQDSTAASAGNAKQHTGHRLLIVQVRRRRWAEEVPNAIQQKWRAGVGTVNDHEPVKWHDDVGREHQDKIMQSGRAQQQII
jgi:hypothetical protein